MNNTTSKKGKVIGIVIALIVIVAGFVYLKMNKPVVKTDGATTSNADWHTYTNSQYGFSLTFPDSWKGYRVVSSSPEFTGQEAGFDFGIKDQDNIFSVSIMNQAQYDVYSKGDLQPSQPVAQRNGKHFFLTVTHNPAAADTSKDADLNKIFASFKFTN